MIEPSLSVKQVCQQLGVGPKTVLFWIASGQLVATNVAKNPAAKRPTYRIAASALERFSLTRRAVAESPELGRVYRRRQHQPIVDRY
jgi:excisionase family DNA binding protein